MAKVMVVGDGAREHALSWKLAQSPHVEKVFVAPGNGGTQQIAENVAFDATDVSGLVKFAERERIDLTIASQDASLASGIVDDFQARGLRIFGPTKAAARVEWSKVYAKQLMSELGIPTAPFRTFTDPKEASRFVYDHGVPIVIKADGLAVGKGAYPCTNIEDAEIAIDEIMIQRLYGDAGDTVIIEEFLPGPEASGQYFCDGNDFIPFPMSEDNKKALDDDQGKNTGGMGAITPVPGFSGEMQQEVSAKIVGPLLRKLSRMGNPFVGCLFPGLKITPGGLRVLEFNARFGDPEFPACVRRLKTDLYLIMNACIDGTLSECKVEWDEGASISIVIASGGYPIKYETGYPISGIKEAEKVPGVKVFHGGTVMSNGVLRTSAGRVLQVTAEAETLRKAFEAAYQAAWCISFKNMHFRHDIGVKALLEKV